MSFYGKIYEQANNIFNRLKFKNANNTSVEDLFQNEDITKDVEISAGGGQSGAVISAGNPWITFEKDDTQNQEDVKLGCKIYHNKPQKNLIADPDTPSSGADCVIKQMPRDGGSDFTKLVGEGSPLTDTEKSNLIKLDQDANLLYFGDKFKTWSPIRDEAGHIVEFKAQQWQIGSVPRIVEILKENKAVETLEGQVQSLIDSYQDIQKTATAAGKSATEAKDQATAAAASAKDAQDQATAAGERATAAEGQATAAAKSASGAITKVDEHIAEAMQFLSNYDQRLTNIGAAVGATDPNTIEVNLQYDSLLDWAKNINSAVGTNKSEEIDENLYHKTLFEWAKNIDATVGTSDSKIIQAGVGYPSLQEWANATHHCLGDGRESLSEWVNDVDEILGDRNFSFHSGGPETYFDWCTNLSDAIGSIYFDYVNNETETTVSEQIATNAQDILDLSGLIGDPANVFIPGLTLIDAISNIDDTQNTIWGMLGWATSEDFKNDDTALTLKELGEGFSSVGIASDTNMKEAIGADTFLDWAKNINARIERIEAILEKHYPEEFVEDEL